MKSTQIANLNLLNFAQYHSWYLTGFFFCHRKLFVKSFPGIGKVQNGKSTVAKTLSRIIVAREYRIQRLEIFLIQFVRHSKNF